MRWSDLFVWRNPVLWVSLVAIGIGAWQVWSVVGYGLGTYPTGTWLALGLFAVYTVPFAAAILFFDRMEPEPGSLLVFAFVWGALVATGFALLANTAIDGMLTTLGGVEWAASWTPPIAGPSTEEPLKWMGLVAIVLLARREVNTTLDGMIYGAFIGLGFQVVEDVVYSIQAIELTGGVDQITPVFSMLLVRGVLAGLWSHALYTAIAGAGIGFAVARTELPRVVRIAVAVAALGLAWVLHFIWNLPVDESGPYGSLVVLGSVAVKGLAAFALLAIIAVLAQLGHRDWLRRMLALEAPRAEVETLMTARSRRRHVNLAGGPQTDGGRRVRRRQDALIDLAAVVARHGTASAEAAAARARVTPSSAVAQRY